MGKIELVPLLCLSYLCLVIVVWLFLAMPRVCLQFVIMLFTDHTHFFVYFFVCQWSNVSFLTYMDCSVTMMLFSSIS